MREDSLPPPLILERYRLRELPPGELARLDARLKTDAALREALDHLDASDRQTLKALKPGDFARRLEIRAEAQARREKILAEHGAAAKAPRTFWMPALAGAAALALVAIPTWFAIGGGGTESETLAWADSGGEPDEETVRIKGLEPHLAIFRKTAQGSEPLAPGEKAHAGEFLRIGYQAGGFAYGAIVSVDGNGNVTRHWPAEGERAARLEKGEALLPEAFELDAAPDYERFYLVVSRRPFDLDPVLASLQEGDAAPRAPEQAKVVRFDILKDTGI